MKKKNANQITFSLRARIQIHNDAENLIGIMDHITQDPVMIRWTIIGKSFKKLKKFYQFFMNEFINEFKYATEFDDHISVNIVDESASVYFVLIMHRPSVKKIVDVSEFVYTTAKEMDCNYNGVWLDFIPVDDPRFDL